jgi:hypothetical protein
LFFEKVTDANPSTITVTPYIGYYAPSEGQVTATGKVTGVPSTFPATLHIPTVYMA